MNLSSRVFGSGTKFGTALTLVVTLFGIVTSLVIGASLGYSGGELLMTTILVMWITIMVSLAGSFYFITTTNRWVVRLLGYLAPDCMPVRMMDFSGGSYYSIAWEKDGEWSAPVFWGTNVGRVYLNRNGSCGKKDCGYVHIWQPVRQSDRAHFFLLNIDSPSFDDYSNWDRDRKYEWLESKRKESQL